MNVLCTLAVLLAACDSKPAFTGEAQVEGLKLESLDAWTSAKAGISAKGTIDCFVNFNSAKAMPVNCSNA